MAKNARSRSWCYTLNNYSEEEYQSLQKVDTTYHVIGLEVGESGTPHLQGFMVFKNARGIPSLKKVVSGRAHFEPMYSTHQAASDYCKKSGKFVESGKLPKPGKRTDIQNVLTSIAKGEVSLQDIALEKPDLYNKYNKSMQIAATKVPALPRKDVPLCIWIWGDSGSGKSHLARDLAKESVSGDLGEIYHKRKDPNGWWEGYYTQKCILVDDFRGEIAYAELLKMCDIFNEGSIAPHRGSSIQYQIVADTIIITSKLAPWQVYHNLAQEDTLDQLFRRFCVYKWDYNTRDAYMSQKEDTASTSVSAQRYSCLFFRNRLANLFNRNLGDSETISSVSEAGGLEYLRTHRG